jgi:phosphoribosyl-AMP cyclohydrolase / phosphoribosyl-ATP pyrophosphohydrolase
MIDLDALKWDATGLVTVVVQDRLTGEIRMLAHANREALARTIETGDAYFYSRSRQSLWRKGESSGHTVAVSEVWLDCDGDAVVYMAEPLGPSCHTGRVSCFFRRITAGGVAADDGSRHAQPALAALDAELAARKQGGNERSYTKRLLNEGVQRIGEKVEEEAGEFVRAMLSESDERVVSEAADVIYHVMVGLLARGKSLRDVEAELARRFGVSGLDEKAARSQS